MNPFFMLKFVFLFKVLYWPKFSSFLRVLCSLLLDNWVTLNINLAQLVEPLDL